MTERSPGSEVGILPVGTKVVIAVDPRVGEKATIIEVKPLLRSTRIFYRLVREDLDMVLGSYEAHEFEVAS